jgi:hypothetical protein
MTFETMQTIGKQVVHRAQVPIRMRRNAIIVQPNTSLFNQFQIYFDPTYEQKNIETKLENFSSQ